MTAVKTLTNRKTERLTNNFAPRNFVEDIEEFSAEWYRRRTLELFVQRRQAGFSDDDPLDPDDPLDMDIIVAICKESRAERYEEEQKIAACR